MNFRDVAVKKIDEAFSRDKIWRVRKIFCLIYCSNSVHIQKETRMDFLVTFSVLNLLDINRVREA